MIYAFIIGPASLVVWIVALLVAKSTMLLSIAEMTRSAAFGHAALMNLTSLAVKLLGLQCVKVILVFFFDLQIIAEDYLLLLNPLAAVYLLTIGFWIGACIEFVYVHWRIGARGRRVFIVLLLYNFCIDAIVAVPCLIFFAQLAAGNVSHI